MGPSDAKVASGVLSLVAPSKVQGQTALLESLGVWREPNDFLTGQYMLHSLFADWEGIRGNMAMQGTAAGMVKLGSPELERGRMGTFGTASLDSY